MNYLNSPCSFSAGEGFESRAMDQALVEVETKEVELNFQARSLDAQGGGLQKVDSVGQR